MRSGTGIAIAMGVMNLGTFGFTIAAAWLLKVPDYGALTATMNLLMVLSVPALGIQATTARRIAADPEHVAQIETVVQRIVWRMSLLLGGVMLLLAPVVNHLLQLDNLPLAMLIAAATVPLNLVGGFVGILQGERRWLALGAAYIANGLPRLLLGVSFLLWHPTAFVAVAVVTVCAFAPVLVGYWALRRHRRPAGPTSTEHRARSVIRETIHNSQALLAFFALFNLDVIVARNALDHHDAGLYAGGVTLAKALTYLPQFVVVVAFPAMASAGQRTRALTRALGLTAALGVVTTAGVWLLSGLALLVIGFQYEEIQGRLWAFALLGTLLSLVQLLVYSVLARQGQRATYLVWAALAAMIVGGLTMDTVNTLLAWVMGVDAVLLVVLVWVSYRLVRVPVAEEQTVPQ